ncbi:MAG TPA: ATP-binding protein [Candidatus Saccharimonadales bacterium]|nr:ATP-binding protein [Candidatus Saccharimonadales bacterium]
MSAKLFLMLMVGYPGAGKTTAAQHIRDLIGAAHLWADLRRREYFDNPQFTCEENALLYNLLNDEATALLASGANVIYDTSFNYYEDRQRMRHIAAQNNAKMFIVHVKVSEEIAYKRATSGANMQPTRILGDMDPTHFRRLSSSLQEPRAHENVIELDGERITREYISAVLKHVGIIE